MFKEIPSKTRLLLKCVRLGQAVSDLRNGLGENFSAEKKKGLLLAIQNDGITIFQNIKRLQKKSIGEIEYFVAFAWIDTLAEKPLGLSILESPRVDISDVSEYVDAILIKTPRQNQYFEAMKLIYEDKNLTVLEPKIQGLYFELFNLMADLFLEQSTRDDEYKKLKARMAFDFSGAKADVFSANTYDIDEVIKELNSLTGLKSVKKDLDDLIQFVKVNQARKNMNLPTVSISLHSVFYGPPGTGKTTVARIIGKAFKALGLLSSGHLVEADRSELVAGYVGQTAIKTKEIIDKALDGVLFIDEAYTLSNQDSYGKEAIDTLLKLMEDNRDRLIVIVAGYEGEMNSFLESNPGLKSRFNRSFFFENYSSNELFDIFQSLVGKNNFSLNDSAKSKALMMINDEINKGDKSFGNARYIRNLYERVLQAQFARIAKISNPTKDDFCMIVAEDF